MSVINYTIPLNNIEIWSLTNQTPIAHPFHIHDVQFFILDINGNPPPPELQGLNDVVLVPAGMGNVRFIAQFNDFADNNIPFMYHCHMLTHEDMGMMGQFIVSVPTDVSDNMEKENSVSIYPNPTSSSLSLEGLNNVSTIELFNVTGQLINTYTWNNKTLQTITLNQTKGIYYIQIKTSNGKNITQKIIHY